MTDIDDKMTLEALQMGVETAQLQIITMNAQLRLILDTLEITPEDVKDEMTEHETAVQKQLMGSVAERVVKLIRMAGEKAGEEVTDDSMGDLLTKLGQEAFGPNVNVRVDTGAEESGIKVRPLDQANSKVTYGDQQVDPDPIQTGPENEEAFSDPELSDDEGMGNGVNAFENLIRGMVEEGPEEIEEPPVFKSSRTPNHATAGGIIMGQVFEGFKANGLDVTDSLIRDEVKEGITEYYLELADNLHDAGVFIGQQYDALVTSLREGIFTDEVADMLPEPGQVCDTVVAQAKEGPEFRVLISSGEEAMEAILTASSISNVRFESEVSAALLPDRLASIGVSSRA